jgi:hypothetical protein
MYMWVFIGLLGNIVQRKDLSGSGKASWFMLLFKFPVLGALIYLFARPSTADATRMEAGGRLQESADEIRSDVDGVQASAE